MSFIVENLTDVVNALRDEQAVAVPTETVYGLAARADSDKAIQQIYTLKQRPTNHPLILHTHPDWPVTRWANNISTIATQLMHAFWPGPLTLVFQTKPGCVSPLITGGQNTVAIRCPSHPLLQAILYELNVPLVAPSANPFGKISPTTAAHVQNSFPDISLMILAGARSTLGIESTIVDVTQPDTYQILRHGSITEKMIEATLHQTQHKRLNTPHTSGQLAQHYQPNKPLYVFTEDVPYDPKSQDKVFMLAFKPHSGAYQQYVLPASPEALAYELYFQLRVADASECDIILMELPPDTPEWIALRERVLKAANNGMAFLR